MKRYTNIARRSMALLVVLAMLLCVPIALAESYSAFANQKTTIYSDMSMKTKLGTISKYTVLNVMNVTDSVAAVKYNGSMCYVADSALSRVSTNATPATVNETTKVYRSPSTSSESTKLKKGWEVYVIAVQDEWALIEREGNSGFCYAKYLSKIPSTSRKGTVTSSSVTVYAKASSSSTKLGTLSKGTTVNVMNVSDSWAYIERNGSYGYCKSSAISVSDNDSLTTDGNNVNISATVTASEVTVYKSASTSSSKLGTLKKGARVMLHSVSGSWAYISLNENYGYCKSSALTPSAMAEDDPLLDSAVSGTITDSVSVYQSATSSSKKLGSLKKNTTVNVISVSGKWAYIELGGNYGYCQADHVKLNGTLNTAAPDMSNAVTAVVNASSLTVFASPSSSATKLGTLSKGTEVKRISVDGSWAYIERNGSYGYCKSSSLTVKTNNTTNSGYTTETFSATVTTAKAKLYSKDSTSSSSQSVSLGTNVTVTAYNSTWAYVQITGSKGYMKISDLSRTTYTVLSAGSSGSAVTSLEKELLALGYFDGIPGTSYTSYTQNAVKLFQQACGISATGNADATTLRVLYGGNAPASSMLSGSYSKGSTGTNVTRLQVRLYSLKYLSKTSSVDGDYGSMTTNAVTLFQKANGLSQTGKADTSTIKKLYSASAVAMPSGYTAADASSSSSGSSSSGSSVSVSSGNQKANSTSISSTLASKTKTFSSSMSNAQKLEYVIYVGQNQLGKKYVFGATGTATFDCSGFTQYSFKQAGIKLLRTAYQQGYNDSYKKISSVSSLKRGDLIFFNTVSDSDSCDHVGIYLGAGWFIHASSGQGKVVVSTVSSGYYNRVFSWGRRILD